MIESTLPDHRRDPPASGASQPTGTPPRNRPIQAHLSLPVLAKVGLVVVATVVVVAAIGRAQQLLGLILMAAVLSATVAPLITWATRFTRLVAANVVVHLLALVVIVSATGVVVQRIQVESDHLEAYTADQLEEFGPGGPSLFERAGIASRVSEATAGWGTTAVVGDDAASGMAMRASQLLVVLVLSAFLTLQGDRLVDAAIRGTPDRDRRRLMRSIWDDGVGAGARVVRRTLLVGLANGVAAAIVASTFGLPGATLIGFWAGLASSVPLVGLAIGWLPLLVVALLDGGGTRAAVVGLVVVIAIAVSSAARCRTGCAGPGALPTTLGIAVGLSAAGVPGAVVGVFAVAALARVVSSDWPLVVSLWSSVSANEPEQATPTPPSFGTEGAEEPVVVHPRRDGVFVDLSTATLLRISALVVVAFMVQLSLSRIGSVLIWTLVGVLIAIGLDRPVTWLERRSPVPRSIVVILGASVFALALVGLGVSARGGIAGIGSVDDDIPRLVETLESLPVVGAGLRNRDLASTFEDARRAAPRLLDASPLAGRVVDVVGGGLVALFWIVAAALAVLVDGPRVVAAIDRRVPATRTRQVSRIAGAARSALAGYVAGSALVASINAFLVGVMAAVTGTPMPLVLALWAFAWNFVPQIGAVIGWTPVLVLAVLANPVVGGLCLFFFVIYQAVENNLIQPTIVGHAVDISPLAALASALFGAAIAGLVGAVLAIPLVAVVHAIRNEVASEDFPRSRPVHRAPLP